MTADKAKPPGWSDLKRRLSPVVESAAYFVVAESLTNAAKFIVREPLDDVLARIIAYRQQIYHRESCPMAAGLTLSVGENSDG